MTVRWRPASVASEPNRTLREAGMGHLTDHADGSRGIKVCHTQKMIEQIDTEVFGTQDQGSIYKKGPVVGGSQSFSYTFTKPISTGKCKLSVSGGHRTR